MRLDPHWTGAIVRGTRDLTQSIREILLEPDCGALPYPPGSHLRVRVLIDGKQDLRHYSLVGAPDPRVWRIAVKREEQGRGGSRYMWALRPGARLEVSQPNCHFELSRDAADHLLVAGGIGITPLLFMATALQRRGTRFKLLYAGRARAEMAYLAELSAELGDRLEIFAEDEGRMIDLDAAFAALDPAGEAYVCGPLGLLEAARRRWKAAARPAARLIYETFGSSGTHPAERFLVRVPERGIELWVPETGSLLDALEAAGVEVLSDCRRGECGLCAVEVVDVDGMLDHRDVFLSERERSENRKLCACVSRAVGAVIIDCGYRPDRSL